MAELARGQHGVVTFAQLRGLGFSGGGIARRVRKGLLHRVHRGVYAVGHAGISLEGRWLAAVLACGDGAVLSHRSAAVLWGLLQPRGTRIEVSVAGTDGRRPREGIHIHRSRSLDDEVRATHNGIPVTTPSRTIADLELAWRTRGCPAGIPRWEVRRATRQAEVLGLDPGAARVAEGTRSDLELAFLRLCEKLGLPRPEVNAKVDRLEVDFLWRSRRFVVETDGYRYHRGFQAFDNDHKRDLHLRSLGYDVLRLSERQVANPSDELARLLRQSTSTEEP